MEIKTLKLSSEMKSNLRAPVIWEKPPNSMYDYHYEISGMYYQPMIKYCMEREQGMKRKKVDLPDRLQSNYDKRSYKIKNTRPDYEEFLVQLYQKRLKANNSRFSHCANEMARMSKESSELGVKRDSGSMRDKYLTQLQLMYTESLAKKGWVDSKGVVQKSGEDLVAKETAEEIEQRETEKRAANQLLVRKKNDQRYGPGYERITVLDSERYNMGEDVDFLSGCYNKAALKSETENNLETSEKTTKITRIVNGKEIVDESYETKQGPMLNKEYLDAETMLDFLTIAENEKLASSSNIPIKDVPAIYRDTTLSRASQDVKARVKSAGKMLLPQKLGMDDMNFNYRERKVEDIGRFERAFVRSTMYKKPALPDFDVGYDVI